jgi:hypothetical protein
MCRSIKQLRKRDERAGEDEVRAAALQFVRKISGQRAPTRKHIEAFEAAVEEISAASAKLLDAMTTTTSTSAWVAPKRPSRQRF